MAPIRYDLTMAKVPSQSKESAEMLAIEALHFLAADPERLSRFLALSGIDATDIRAAATAPGFLAGLLDHIAGDQTLLADFAAAADVTPEHVDKARIALAGADWQREMP
jgi:hypothetical protein